MPSFQSDRPRPFDPLSDVLNTVRLTGTVFFAIEASSPWAAAVPNGSAIANVITPGAQHIISYHVVTSGRCWANLVDSTHAPLELQAGDILVLPQGDAYWMSLTAAPPPRTDSAQELAFLEAMARGDGPPCVRDGGGGPDAAHLLCGFLGCDLTPFNPLLTTLPRILIVRGTSEHGSRLTQLADVARREALTPSAGGECVRLRLSELLFVEIVRSYLAALPAERASWLAGLRDPSVGHALALLHARAAHAWTLEQLAQEVGMSRTVLTERFAAFVGEAPMQYLMKWRMQVAARMLADGTSKVAAVAELVGYQSEAAFSRAFKKVTGVAPSAWKRR
jgi:AraC-like DNA-binding protein